MSLLFLYRRVPPHGLGARLINLWYKSTKFKISLLLLNFYCFLLLDHGSFHGEVIENVRLIVVNFELVCVTVGDSALFADISFREGACVAAISRQWLRLQLNVALVLSYTVITHLKWSILFEVVYC